MLWLVWLIFAVLAFAAELTSLSLYLGSFGAAALVTAGVSLAAPLPVQLATFVAGAVVFLFGVRPVVLRFLPLSSPQDTVPRLGPVGRRGVVVERVDSSGGQIRIGRGEFWSARTEVPGAVIPPGQEVEVERFDGLVAIVRPVAAPPLAEATIRGTAQPFGLSAREVEVLRLVTAGLSNDEIARRLVLSPRTVHHHVSHILTKMNVDSRVDAARLATQRGLLPPED